MKAIKLLPLLLLLASFIACTSPVEKSHKVQDLVPISKIIPKAVIYEANIRQYTPEGTINAFAKNLPRLKNLGIDIIWLMPIYPISEEKRKGDLGSYYAVADYKAVNPELGTMEDMKNFVDEAHNLGMYVILDWVANHTGWDNPWIYNHPEWYTKNDTGEIIAPVADWTDVADLNYDVPEMRSAMIDALKFWIEDVDIDGYRCDVAGSVPVDFWNEARVALDSIKAVFMLAEAWEPELMEKAFDANYGWELHHITNEIAKRNRNAADVDEYFNEYMKRYAEGDILMNFITNHDENSWNGTEYERYGDGVKCMVAFTYVIPGMPLIYTGQEAALNKRLQFFTKDTVQWADTSLYGFYRTLNTLKRSNAALLAGENAGLLGKIESDNDNVYALYRENSDEKVIGVFNFSDVEINTTIRHKNMSGTYTNIFNNEEVVFDTLEVLKLKPWEYLILEK